MQKKIAISLISLFICCSCDFSTSHKYYDQSLEYQKRGDFKKEQKLLEKVLEKDSKYRPALFNHAINNADFGNYKASIGDHQKILEFDSDNTLVLMSIGNNHAQLADYNKA